jgi:hypothetical protein
MLSRFHLPTGLHNRWGNEVLPAHAHYDNNYDNNGVRDDLPRELGCRHWQVHQRARNWLQ